jgi:dTDP-4-dehydrorhamnose reductase
MKIAITGAGGLVGSALERRLSRNHEAVALGHGQLDITDRDAVFRFVAEGRPDLIINCAVLGVDACESDPAMARRINVDGPACLAEAANSIGGRLLHFSSNYVFDGEREDHLYTIEDRAMPINVYGSTKLEGESSVTSRCPRAYVVRTSWVFGAGKESFLSTAWRKLANGEALRAITDIRASATFVEDLAGRIEEIIGRNRFATYEIVNEGVCSYESFAVECARLLGLSQSESDRLIERVLERDMQRLAWRPRSTPMRCLVSEEIGLSPMPDWKDALARYIRLRN